MTNEWNGYTSVSLKVIFTLIGKHLFVNYTLRALDSPSIQASVDIFFMTGKEEWFTYLFSRCHDKFVYPIK